MRQELQTARDTNEALQTEMAELRWKLEWEKANYKSKELWRMNCSQLSEFDSTLEESEQEIAELKRQLAEVSRSGLRYLTPTAGWSSSRLLS